MPNDGTIYCCEYCERFLVSPGVTPNAPLQARGAAAATQERRLFPVASKRWFGPYAVDTAVHLSLRWEPQHSALRTASS
jgi:hypothetical protein